MLIASVVLCHYCAWRTLAVRHGHGETSYRAEARLERRDNGEFIRLGIRIIGPPHRLAQAAARACRIAAALTFPVEWDCVDRVCAVDATGC